VNTAPPFAGARDVTERWLAGIWARALGRDRIDVTEPVGPPTTPQAVAAARAVAAQLIERLGADLDADRVLARSSVERQADLLRDRIDGTGGSPVRVLRAPGEVTGGGRVPLFLFHPAGSIPRAGRPGCSSRCRP
jgi:phthiocerol/phenolphthiocerol synthesis type-I polyketide synthase D